MRHAMTAGLVTGVTTSLVGTWVVLRGMAFMGDALAHGVLPGLTLAYLLEISLILGAAVAAVVVIGGVGVVQRCARLRADTGIGLLFVGMLALGVIIASKAQSYAGDLTAILFGDVLGVTDADIGVAAVAAVVAIVLTVVLYRPFIVLALDERKAAVLGLRPRLAHVVLLALLAAAIIASFRAVGVLLVFGFLIAPPATAALVTRRVPVMMLAAIGFAVVGVLAGLLVSFHLGTAGSATMVGVTVAEFFLILLGKEVRGWLAASAANRPPVPDGSG
ncbi:MAG: metal ABC transporter permease [Pseudonocardiaceae bacterium]|nr:metal ABC transporter permease [Pseudonocardiaceae bacterium]